MEERFEFRLLSSYVSEIGDAVTGPRRFPDVARAVRGKVGDAVYSRIGELHGEVRESGHGLVFGSWDITRTYSRAEIDRATLIMLRLPFTHLAGEECGTKYDESNACSRCGLGSQQVGPLLVSFGKLPKSRDLIRLWGGELLVSERLARLIRAGGFTGNVLSPATHLRLQKGHPDSAFTCAVRRRAPLVCGGPGASTRVRLAVL